MNFAIPWIAFIAAVAGIGVFSTWGRNKRRNEHAERRKKFNANPRKAA